MIEQYKYWRTCAMAGPIFMFVFIVFWGLMGFNLPPIQPDTSAEFVASIFRDNANSIRAGMVVGMSFSVFYMIWGVAIMKVMETLEGENNILSVLQMWGAGLTVVPVLVSCSFWLTGAYRPEALDPTILQMLYDMAWLLIDLAYSVTSVQMIAFGVLFLSDKRDKPLIPKWLSWFSIWIAFMFIIEVLMPFFKSGVFARHGFINFWVEFLIWFIWVPLVSVYIIKAVNRLKRESA